MSDTTIDAQKAISSNGQNAASVIKTMITYPTTLPITMLIYSATQYSFSGIIYVFYLMVFVIIRNKLLSLNGDNISDECKETIFIFGDLNVPQLNLFISLFTVCYIFGPMLIYNSFNPFVMIIFIFYFIINIIIQIKCIAKNIMTFTMDCILAVLFAGVSLFFIIVVMGNLFKLNPNLFLFVDNTTSNQEVCSMPKQQKFVCSVYKNGELVGNT